MNMLRTVPPEAAYVVPLRHVTRADLGRAGAKAANLGELGQAGFPVPDGFVVTTAAFDRFISANAIATGATAAAVEAAPLPADVEAALHAAALPLDGTALAVRSSGVAEDLAGASFAGQYETMLDVRGPEALVAAVRRCWASAFSRRVRAYQGTDGQAASGRMAVLVQHLIQADSAGVAFTANPLTGDRSETVVSAVRGLGERLVSGEASPDEWIVRGGEAVRQSAPEDAIDASQALTIAALARRAEAHFGVPQDVEWAIAGGQLFMLQARPITTLRPPPPAPIPLPAEPPPGFWESDAEHFPKPVSPLTRSLALPTFTAAMAKMCAQTGLLLDRLEYREIGGWVYLRMVPLGEKDQPALPAWLMWLLVRAVPALRARLKRAAEFVRNDEMGALIERWYEEWHPETARAIAERRDVDLAALSDEALADHLAKTIALMTRGNEIHFLLGAANPFAIYDLVTTCQELLGWDEPQVMSLLAGLSQKSTEPSRRLAALASLARQRPAVWQLIQRPGPATPQKLAQIDPKFSAAFEAYLREYGCRGLAFDLSEPTVAEVPQLVLGWIRDQVAREYDPAGDQAVLAARREEAAAAARAVLAARPAGDRARFERALERAIRAYPTQEDNVFFTQGAPTALGRYALLEVGRRLAERQVIAERDDVFFLEIQEAQAALQRGGDLRALVLRRRGEHAWAGAHPGPATYGQRPSPPPLDALPAESRFQMSVVPWYFERALATGRGRTQAAGASLTGIAASPGQYRGAVRVVLNERQFHKLQPGDVLVCPATTPVWSVLFASVGALVTDTGGILSHPAIIAREYRVPAVVATGNATSLLKDGQIVTVDGSSGRVEIHV